MGKDKGELKKQIPGGNDRKKGKCKGKCNGKDKCKSKGKSKGKSNGQCGDLSTSPSATLRVRARGQLYASYKCAVTMGNIGMGDGDIKA